MKVFILLAVVAVSHAAVLLGGASEHHRSEDGHGNYAFAYNEGHGSGATFRKESGSPGAVVGSYGLSDADGRRRVVNYVADGAGFRADIKTNEPGVEPKDPAHIAINKAALVAPVHHTVGSLHHALAPVHYAAAPVHHGVGSLQHAVAPIHHGGAYAYNTVVGHHGLGHHGYYF